MVLFEMEMEMKMGSSFKKAIFDEHIQDGLVGWARMAKKKKNRVGVNAGSQMEHSTHSGIKDGPNQ